MSFILDVRDRTLSGQRPTSAINFPQQGTVDWTQVAFTSVKSSINILSRISLANVDPYTIFVSQVVAGELIWSEEGRQRFDTALSSCQGVPGYHKALWFGLGVKHIIDVLTSTEQGARCSALCACLAECYTVSYASGIMAELVKASPIHIDTVPSLQQWRALVDSCAGILAKSPFGIRAEHFMHLDGEAHVAAHNSYYDHRRTRSVASREAIADALQGLVQLSQGRLHQMTVIGRADVGFIAAVAEWLVGLGVTIVDGDTGETLFTNCTGEQEPRLMAVFEKSQSNNALYCVGKTYRLPDASSLIINSREHRSTAVLSGRVPWQRALELTFGNDFKRLTRMAHSCSRAIGSAAAIFASLVRGDRDIPMEWRRNCHMRFPQSYGTGYVYLAQSSFPELEILDAGMRSAARASSFDEARREYEVHIESLSMGCECGICCPTLKSADNERSKDTAYCLVALVETIIVTIRSLSGILSEISPMRAGLEAMYDTHLLKMRTFGRRNDLSPFQRIIENGIPATTDLPLLYIAESIYGGHRCTERLTSKSFMSAIAENGLCYFLDILREPTRSAATLGRVNVVVGRIEHLERPYHKVQDAGETDPPFSGEPRNVPCIPQDDLDLIKNCSNSTLEVLVKEIIPSLPLPHLSVEYGVNVKGTIIGTFGPSRAVLSMCQNEGIVSCARGACVHPILELARSASVLKHIRTAESAAATSHYRKIMMDTSTLHIFSGDIVTTSLAACKVWDPIIQQDECMACCVQTAIQSGWTDFGIICCGRFNNENTMLSDDPVEGNLTS